MKQEWLTYDQLRAEQARHAARGPAPGRQADYAREQMAFALIIQDKLNLSIAVFAFALLGVPLGIKVSRRETSANLGLALLLVLGYYLVTVAVKWLDHHPEFRPDLLLWLPNVLFIGLGLWLFTRIERQ
jgi:lipopolysaccharide export system permease protein